MKQNRQAFTMLELVIVITVLGILAALAIPRMQRDLRQEAADNLVSAIRYTQHLAMMDDVTDPSQPTWQQKYWHIYVGTCKGDKYYAIGSDVNMESSNNGRVDFEESAIDPANGKHMWAHDASCSTAAHPLSDLSPNVFIGKRYGVKDISYAGGCANSYLGFDYLGRPHVNFGTADLGTAWNAPMANDCTITFTFKDGSDDLILTVQKETGFVQVVDQNGS